MWDGSQIEGRLSLITQRKLTFKVNSYLAEMSTGKMRITGRHVAAARDLLKMTQAELAAAAKVAPGSVNSFEQGLREPRPTTLDAIRQALEDRGIEFFNGEEPGVRLRPSKAIIRV